MLRLTKHGKQFFQFMYEDQTNHVRLQIIRYQREKMMVYTMLVTFEVSAQLKDFNFRSWDLKNKVTLLKRNVYENI